PKHTEAGAPGQASRRARSGRGWAAAEGVDGAAVAQASLLLYAGRYEVPVRVLVGADGGSIRRRCARAGRRADSDHGPRAGRHATASPTRSSRPGPRAGDASIASAAP